jgi:hypothetical protein
MNRSSRQDAAYLAAMLRECVDLVRAQWLPFVDDALEASDVSEVCVYLQGAAHKLDSLSIEKTTPGTAATVRASGEQATAKKPYSPPMLSHLPADDPRVQRALSEIGEGE